MGHSMGRGINEGGKESAGSVLPCSMLKRRLFMPHSQQGGVPDTRALVPTRALVCSDICHIVVAVRVL